MNMPIPDKNITAQHVYTTRWNVKNPAHLHKYSMVHVQDLCVKL